jgi:hypothetical protein
VTVKPESLKSNDGGMTVFLRKDAFPDLCGTGFPTAGDVDWAGFEVVAYEPRTRALAERVSEDRNRIHARFVRSELGGDPLGTRFVLVGRFSGDGTFYGLDRIRKNP